MHKRWQSVGTVRPIGALGLGALGLAAIVALDKLHWRTSVFRETHPDLSPDHLLRSAGILLSVAVLWWGVTTLARPARRETTAVKGRRWLPFERWAVQVTLAFSMAFLVLFAVSPATFSLMSLEDGWVEWLSAIMFFAGSALFAAAAIARRGHRPRIIRWGLWGAALVGFVVGMEEISWMQRVLGIAAFGAFTENAQEEINLHNFATNRSEVILYVGTVAFLVGIPFLRSLGLMPAAVLRWSILLPRPYLAVIGAAGAAYNYDMWNIVFIQVGFFGSLLILLFYGHHSADRPTRVLTLGAIPLLVITQWAFVAYGDGFSRLWDVTEYRELFIALGFALYAMGIRRRIVELEPARKQTASVEP